MVKIVLTYVANNGGHCYLQESVAIYCDTVHSLQLTSKDHLDIVRQTCVTFRLFSGDTRCLSGIDCMYLQRVTAQISSSMCSTL